MKISISGQQIAIGSVIQDYVKDRIDSTISAYFDQVTSAAIHFKKQNIQIETDIIVHVGTGQNITLKSNAICDDIYSCFDLALAKLEKQLRKYSDRINNKSTRLKTSEVIESIAGKKYIISPYNNEEIDSDKDEYAAIIAEKPTDIHTLTVSDAVMKMDLENLPALLFKNAKTNRINVVYYRKDGNISWVDTASV